MRVFDLGAALTSRWDWFTVLVAPARVCEALVVDGGMVGACGGCAGCQGYRQEQERRKELNPFTRPWPTLGQSTRRG